ncbi:flagellar basal body-associated FliL family protein [Rickettsia endosymbiont of Cardiosporidium cionae]|uniref:flagellar basal body-associated FliL family protein n=1 Tax=Rickettsia endosymbiont of Cardiosporidium cionae TaxID=2777155 RepID=UPI001892E068|nr:flagellar basal body-associated FliL family protein [Rickettsia endosymbiont of Cardiosporidium cionae]KAF8818595.1 hypothetical protein IHI24_000314 [Rickettsia endosymbiont of Cardiosporidium cionae]
MSENEESQPMVLDGSVKGTEFSGDNNDTKNAKTVKNSIIYRVKGFIFNSSVIVVLSALSIIVGAFIVYYSFFYNSHKTLTPNNSSNNYVELGPMLVELHSTSSSSSKKYLRLGIFLKLALASDVKVVKTMFPVIKDNILVFLTSLNSLEFHSTAGLLLIKEELLKRVSKIVAPVVVQEILLKEIVTN